MNIRLETPADYREVENLTREAFWNVYRPGWLKANGISEATYCPPKGYFVADENPEAFDAYDATFPPKQKLRLPGQLTYDGVMETSRIILRPPSGRVMEKCGFVPTGETCVDESLAGSDRPMRVLRIEIKR